MNHNKLILPLLLVAVVVSVGFGSSYAQTDEAELVDQINRLNDRLLELQATQANIENKIDKFETKRDNVQAGLDRLQERGGSEEKIEKRIAKLANIDKNIAKLEANKIKNQEKIDDIELEIADKRSELAGTGPSATQSDRSGRGEAPRGLAENGSSSDEGATGASNHVPAQITDFRATFIPHNVNNTNPQAGAYWDKPERVSITGYVLEHMSSDETEFTLIELDSDIKSYFIDAEYGLDYSFKIAATNSNGTGPVSDIQTVTVIRYDQDPPVFDSVADYTYSGSSLLLPLTYDFPTATDDVDDDVEVTCTPEKLNVGENEIFCRAHDDAGHLAMTSFTITVPAHSFDSIDCTINVAMGGEVVREFHPSECNDQYDGLILAHIPRSMLYGSATLDTDRNIVEIMGPEMSPDLTPSEPPTQEEIDYLVTNGYIQLVDDFEFVPRQAKSESFGITLDPRYGIDKPAINIAVNYVPIPDIMIKDYLGATVTHDLPTPGVPANYTFVSVRSTDQLRDDGVTVTGTESNGIITLTFNLPDTSDLDTINGHVVVRYDDDNDERQKLRVPVTIDFLPGIVVRGNFDATVTHDLQTPGVPTDYEFVSVGVTTPLRENGVTVTGTESNGIITLTFNLPETSADDTVAGHVVVRYDDVDGERQNLRVPVTIDYLTFSPITVSATGGQSVDHILMVSNVPEDYEFASVMVSKFVRDQGVTVTGTESNGIITLTFNLPDVNEAMTFDRPVVVRYNDGNDELQKFRVPTNITILPE